MASAKTRQICFLALPKLKKYNPCSTTPWKHCQRHFTKATGRARPLKSNSLKVKLYVYWKHAILVPFVHLSAKKWSATTICRDSFVLKISEPILRAKIENMISPDYVLCYIPQANGNFGKILKILESLIFRIIISKVGGKL